MKANVSIESIEDRLATILSGRFKVKGFGLNGVLRILAAHHPKLWPVYNGAVREALVLLGRGFTVHPTGEGYAQFTREMRRFATEAGAPDMIAFDAFFRRHILGKAGS